ncbi:MAG: hemerythrin domain-containing protein [Gammaproteobacteria bacterium]|nr:hemerythrin domain-containing protein [Gammaproteobacteria bacterium]
MPKQSKSTTASQSKSSSAVSAGGDGQDAVALLSADHRAVEQLFEQYQGTSDQDQKSELAHKVCVELTVHSMLEEEIFYPACREKGVEHDALDEAQVEHDGVKVLVNDLLMHPVRSPYYDAKVKVLSDYVQHHVAEEERAGDGIFARASAAGVEMTTLGQRISQRKPQLMAQVQSPGFRPPPVRSLDLASERRYPQENVMERGYDRDRDEQGRFMSEGRGRGYSRRDDDDSRYGSRGSRGGHGGWSGDPEGHSRASEEGWESRGGGGGYGRGRDYDDDERYSSGGGSSRGRGHGGWFGESEGHSRASEEGWEQRGGGGGGYGRGRDYDENERYSSRGGSGSSGSNRGRSQGGWFGDPEGHSRASEEGWEHRRGGGGYGRSRDDDDERYSSRGGGGDRGRGHGGWYGDREGHSQAAERGWRNR